MFFLKTIPAPGSCKFKSCLPKFCVSNLPKSKGDRAFSVAGPKLWNNLPFHIRSTPTIGAFKATLLYLILYM